MQLLERTEQLATLLAEYRQIANGGRLVLVSGEAGAGKSALVREFLAVHAADVDVLFGQCDDLFAPRPLGPMADIARGRPGPLASALAAGDEAGVFDAFLTELASPSHPAIVVLEDLQWADEATLDLLRFVARRLDVLSSLIIATHRDDLPADHSLRRVAGSLIGPGVTRIHVPPLSVDAVRQLLGTRAAEAEPFHAQTGGNPFFVIEALRSEPGVLPTTVRDMILARTVELSGCARDALDAVAVLGHAEAEVVQAVGDCDAIAIDEGVAAGLLDADGHLSFRHDLGRQVIDDAMTPLRKRQLHARAYTALGENGDVVQRAHHAIAAATPEAIVDVAVKAADQCVALGAHVQAASLYASAAEFAALLPREEQLTLHLSRAKAAYEAERVDEAVIAGEAALALMPVDDPATAAWACWLGEAYWTADMKDEAWRALFGAIERLEPKGDSPELAYAKSRLACHHMMNGTFDEAIRHSYAAQEMADRLGETATALNALGFAGTSKAAAGDPTGLTILRDAADRAKQAGLFVEAARAGNNLGCQLIAYSLPQAAVDAFDEFIAIAVDNDFFSRRTCLRLGRAEASIMLGDWDGAVADTRSIFALEDLTQASRSFCLWHLGRVRARRGDPGPFELLDPSLAAAEDTTEANFIVPIRITRAEAWWLAGDVARARAEIDAGIEYDDVLEAHYRRNLAFWARRLGIDWVPECDLEPIELILAGDTRGLAEFWAERGCLYDAADALGDSDEIDDLREAHDQLTAMGARPRAQMVARKLRDLGAREVKRGPRASTRANAAGLTARELEVAALLVKGMTNTEIADELVLSHKTVEHHVSAVLSKLGVNNRRHVGRAADKLGLALVARD